MLKNIVIVHAARVNTNLVEGFGQRLRLVKDLHRARLVNERIPALFARHSWKFKNEKQSSAGPYYNIDNAFLQANTKTTSLYLGGSEDGA